MAARKDGTRKAMSKLLVCALAREHLRFLCQHWQLRRSIRPEILTGGNIATFGCWSVRHESQPLLPPLWEEDDVSLCTRTAKALVSLVSVRSYQPARHALLTPLLLK